MKLTKTAEGKMLLTISRSEWEGAGRSSGWLRTATEHGNDVMPVELYDNLANATVAIELEINFDVAPKEYEGPYVFYEGGIAINRMAIAEPFTFRGKTYLAGQEFPEELAAYVSDCDFDDAAKAYECLQRTVEDFLRGRGVRPKEVHHRMTR